MKPLISIVLCTYNNADSLEITMNQLAAMDQPEPGLIEVIIVDNNSPDHTAQIAQNFSARHPYFHYHFEPKQGLSHARNTGLEKAQGEYILFTDDDADIPSHWTKEYINAIRNLSPDCLYSKIRIIWDKPKPWWFLPQYTPCFVGLDYGDKLLEINDIHREFYGKNFCVKKTLLIELGGFDPNLGRQGSKLAAGEETLLYRKMIWANKKVIYFPSAGVGHRLKEREYTSENIKKLFVDGAHSSFHIAKLTARKKFMGRPVRLLIDALTNSFSAALKFLFASIKMDKAARFYHYLCICKNFTLIKLWLLSS
ncbi:glycosyltransferase family 2 protein [Cellvibrio sp. UBA7661]|uniref:glycosyltransferase family 2 protein n=1 Tax=Cellvibrio sp. UBA7661 TaxID=1946311 RepID=UPI002F35DFA3